MNSFSEIKQFAKQEIFPLLEKGDPNWDRPHAEATAFHMQKILEQPEAAGCDPEVMLFAAYAHDVGYSKFYKEGVALPFEEYVIARRQHMDTGVEIVSELLKQTDFTESQKKQIFHLISIHDKIEELETTEERLLAEADTLGGQDVNFVKPSFSFEQNEKHQKGIRERRLPVFVTEYGKRKFEELTRLRREYYEKKKESL